MLIRAHTGLVQKVAAPVALFPQVIDRITTASPTQQPTHTVNSATTVTPGNLLLLLVNAGDGNFTLPAGWSELLNLDTTTASHMLYYKVAAGTEGGTFQITNSDTNESMGTQLWQISNWYGTLAGVEAALTGDLSTSTIDPPSLTPSWGSANTLWIFGAVAADDAVTVSTWPANYTNLTYVESGGAANDTQACAMGSRELAAASEDPGAVTWSQSQRTDAFTVAVRPAA